MFRIVTVPLFAILLTVPVSAFEWSGRLVDADCTHRNGGPHACDPGLNTTNFGLLVNGKPFLFDWRGSQKAAEAIRHRAEASAAYNKPLSHQVNATVIGERYGERIEERVGGSHKIRVRAIVIDPAP
jgi:hypothetical protein